MIDLFVSCRPGLERWLAVELRDLGHEALQLDSGGVALQTDEQGLVNANLWLGVATAVLIRMGTGEARHFRDLVQMISRLSWSDWLNTDVPVIVRAVSRRSRLYHTEAIAERVQQGIAEALGKTPTGDGPPIEVLVRLHRDRCDVSINSSGEGLHRRGWRQQTAKAPMREDLARALLRTTGWTPQESLCDPMMGSGTLVIEAATMARNLAPGRLRAFALERLRVDAGLIAAARRQANADARDQASVRIVGRDRDLGAVAAARGNATRAGVLEDLVLERADLRDAELPAVDCVVTNPPYGQRVDLEDSVLASLGERVRSTAPRRVGIVVPRRALALDTGLRLVPRLMTVHGGQKVEFMVRQAPVASSRA